MTIHFSGIKFTLYRFILTFIAVILIGVLTAKIINHKGGILKWKLSRWIK